MCVFFLVLWRSLYRRKQKLYRGLLSICFFFLFFFILRFCAFFAVLWRSLTWPSSCRSHSTIRILAAARNVAVAAILEIFICRSFASTAFSSVSFIFCTSVCVCCECVARARVCVCVCVCVCIRFFSVSLIFCTSVSPSLSPSLSLSMCVCVCDLRLLHLLHFRPSFSVCVCVCMCVCVTVRENLKFGHLKPSESQQLLGALKHVGPLAYRPVSLGVGLIKTLLLGLRMLDQKVMHDLACHNFSQVSKVSGLLACAFTMLR